MKKSDLFKLMLLLFATVLIGFSSCKEEPDPEPEVDYLLEMTNYMKANNLDLNNITTDWVILAADIHANLDNYYIIDLRSAADFGAGHVEGAVNSTMTGVLDAAQNSGGKTIILTCYTGQNAGYAHVALRLSGYSTCKIMKWGMSGWNAQFDVWSNNTSDQGATHTNWSTTNTIETSVMFSLPTFTATETTGAGILAERVDYILEQGFKGVDAVDVLTTPTNYFINNYWTEETVNTYGHIKGAYRINEDLTLAADGFKYLDPASTVITYCWTGQTSALVSAYLTLMGYDAKSLKFGANAMIHEQLQMNKWSASADLPYVTD
jgi:rhodanese-related sulfurtransferase